MDKLLAYINSLVPAEQTAFAVRCGTSIGYLRKAVSARQRLREGLCIAIERESAGGVPLESLRDDVDWGYLTRRCSSQAPAAAAPETQGAAHA